MANQGHTGLSIREKIEKLRQSISDRATERERQVRKMRGESTNEARGLREGIQELKKKEGRGYGKNMSPEAPYV